MANSKLLQIGHTTGRTIYVIVKANADGKLLNDADGAFAAAPADPFVALTEDATISGLYERAESRTAWADGVYTVVTYDQAGVGPVPASDELLDVRQICLKDDLIVTLNTVLAALASAAGIDWDALLASHTAANSFGALMNRARTQFGLT
jgi:hypothetical protein